jgi:hypothetical protein
LIAGERGAGATNKNDPESTEVKRSSHFADSARPHICSDMDSEEVKKDGLLRGAAHAIIIMA